jgi:hypothetical protein
MPQFVRSDLRQPATEKPDELSLGNDQKFAWVESQIRRVALGKAESIGCPYCLSSIIVGVDRLCCPSMGEATASVLRRMEAECAHETEGIRASGPHPIAETDETQNGTAGNTSTQVIQ